jgi:ArsR family transcriptional regulator, arsenate/arsenite/antimonite-responsive transcriptional repressor
VEARAAVEALGALAQESRLAVFRLLVRQGPGGMPAGRVAEALGIPPATLSFHLAQLGHAGLVLSRRDGRRIIYSADYDAMQELMAFLTEKCCRTRAARGTGAEMLRSHR